MRCATRVQKRMKPTLLFVPRTPQTVVSGSPPGKRSLEMRNLIHCLSGNVFRTICSVVELFHKKVQFFDLSEAGLSRKKESGGGTTKILLLMSLVLRVNARRCCAEHHPPIVDKRRTREARLLIQLCLEDSKYYFGNIRRVVSIFQIYNTENTQGVPHAFRCSKTNDGTACPACCRTTFSRGEDTQRFL